jgi:hypothetical protein
VCFSGLSPSSLSRSRIILALYGQCGGIGWQVRARRLSEFLVADATLSRVRPAARLALVSSNTDVALSAYSRVYRQGVQLVLLAVPLNASTLSSAVSCRLLVWAVVGRCLSSAVQECCILSISCVKMSLYLLHHDHHTTYGGRETQQGAAFTRCRSAGDGTGV